MKAVPIFFSTMWGNLLLRFTRSYPVIENKDILDKFFKE